VFAGAFAVLSPAVTGFITALITPKDSATTANGAKSDTGQAQS